MRRERAKLTTSLIVFAALAPACPRPRVSARGRLRDVTQRDRQGTSWGRDWELSVLRFTARRQYECGAARPIRAHGFREQCERRQSWPGGGRFFFKTRPPSGRGGGLSLQNLYFFFQNQYNASWQKEAVNRGQNWLFNR